MKRSNFSIFFILLVLVFSLTAAYSQNTKIIKESTVTTEKGKTLTISIVAGNIDISTWDRNEVEVKVSGSGNADEIMTIDINSTSTGVNVDGQKKNGFNKKSFNLNVKFEIKVPVEYNVDAFTGGGGVSVANLNGTLKINTSGGNMDFENITGNINASTAGGNVKIDKNKGSLDISTSGGNIKATGFDGTVKVSTMGGNISLTGTNGNVNAHTGGGNITLDYSGKNEGIDISTMAGNIHLDLPSDIDADADISTLVGKISSDFASAENGKTSSFLKTKFNSGGNLLKCTTSAGNITVNKK